MLVRNFANLRSICARYSRLMVCKSTYFLHDFEYFYKAEALMLHNTKFQYIFCLFVFDDVYFFLIIMHFYCYYTVEKIVVLLLNVISTFLTF